jgi:hypothetical protein
MSRPITPAGERLLKRITINEETGCWEWQGAVNNIGYGMIRDGKKMRTTHRVSYEYHTGDIPDDKCVLHTCDNRKCANPDHLWIGTHKENIEDMISKGRDNWSPQEQITCEHCGYTCGKNMHTRWHGDNCKHKPCDK